MYGDGLEFPNILASYKKWRIGILMEGLWLTLKVSVIAIIFGVLISLIKDSSLLGLIAIRELTKATREVITTSLQPFELWFVCAILYLILTFSLSMFVQYLERRTQVT